MLQKNKCLPIFIQKSESLNSIQNIDFKNLFENGSVIVINMNFTKSKEIEKQWLSEIDKDNHNDIYFIHMMSNVFEKAGKVEDKEKVDFSVFHFFYDIYKPSLKKKFACDYFSCVYEDSFDKINKVFHKEPDKMLVKENDDSEYPSVCRINIRHFEQILESDYSTKEENDRVRIIDAWN